jgi:uncharacterized protein YjiS (DUF1127 family)
MSMIRNYRNWRRFRKTVNELSRLTDRELDDMGLRRGDIYSVAKSAN